MASFFPIIFSLHYAIKALLNIASVDAVINFVKYRLQKQSHDENIVLLNYELNESFVLFLKIFKICIYNKFLLLKFFMCNY